MSDNVAGSAYFLRNLSVARALASGAVPET
jgi:hypothetical protein